MVDRGEKPCYNRERRTEIRNNMSFSSSVYHQMDDKYRIRIPVKYKAALGSDYILVAGDQRCISVYPRAAWDAHVEDMAQRVRESHGDPRMMKAMRRIVSSVEDEVKEDGQGRITISSMLRNHLKIQKGDRELITVGMQDHLEIWKVSDFEDYGDEMTMEEAYAAAKFFG